MRYFYVSVVRSPRKRAFLAGPYTTHAEALSNVERVRKAACELDPWMDFDAFGTASSELGMRTHFGI
jgi:hypothetical protein